jgi:hypothetical protein
MPIDPNIAMGVRPIEQPNMLAQMGQMMQLRQAQQEYEGSNALRDFYAQGGDINKAEDRQRLLSRAPMQGQKILGQESERQSRDIKTQADSLKTIKDNIGLANTPEAMAEYLRGAYGTPGGALLAKFVPLETAIAKIPTDPKGFADYQRNFSLTADKLFVDANTMASNQARIQAAGIGAAPGMMNANLAREKYTDQLRSGGDIITSLVKDPETGQDVEMQFKRNLRTGAFEPVVLQPPPMQVDISPSSATSSYQTGGGGASGGAASTNVLATQVAPQGGVAPVANVNGLNPNAPQTQQPIFARPLPKVPSGPLAAYRKTADGTGLEPIPGGPADPAVKALQATETLSAKDIAARNAKYPQATSALKGFEAKTGKFERDIDELIANEKGLNEITGFLAGRTDLSAMTKEGRRALALFNTITAKGGFSELQDMRNASPTGGALGNVSNQEGKQLIDSVGALARTQDANDLRKSLTTLKSDLQGSKQRVREAYDLTYEYRIPAGTAPNAATPEPSNAPPTIKTEAEYNALPSGATYVDPDGVSRRKR